MADDADRAAQDIEMMERAGVSMRKQVPNIKPSSKCHYCNKSVESPKLFCDGVCATKHARQ